MENISEEDAAYISAIFDSCFKSYQDGIFENKYENVTRIEQSLQVTPTKLRSSPIYYRLYYVHLNTIFASLIPLVSLLFLNVATVRALRKMVKVSQY